MTTSTELDPTPGPGMVANRSDLDPIGGDEATAILRRLLDGLAGLRGALLGSVDGRPVASVLPRHDAGSTAAIVAASLGLGSRLADLAGAGQLEEIVVRSASGYVVLYAVGDVGVLTVLASAGANLARLHLEARRCVADLLAAVTP